MTINELLDDFVIEAPYGFVLHYRNGSLSEYPTASAIPGPLKNREIEHWGMGHGHIFITFR